MEAELVALRSSPVSMNDDSARQILLAVENTEQARRDLASAEAAFNLRLQEELERAKKSSDEEKEGIRRHMEEEMRKEVEEVRARLEQAHAREIEALRAHLRDSVETAGGGEGRGDGDHEHDGVLAELASARVSSASYPSFPLPNTPSADEESETAANQGNERRKEGNAPSEPPTNELGPHPCMPCDECVPSSFCCFYGIPR